MSVCAADHPILGALLGDPELARLFALEAELEAMLCFERALAEAEAALGVIPCEASQAIASTCDRFRPDLDAIR